VFDRLEATAKSREIAVQPRATGLAGIPNRYMHSPVEVAHLENLDRAARLLAEFCLDLTPEVD
jgi:putative aminopeptidase FrvX